MTERLLLKVGKSRRQDLLRILKRSGRGMAVNELAGLMKLSYMGTKEICADLKKTGYLSTWRKPVPRGRPELLYRLTRKAEELFPKASNGPLLTILASSAKLFGQNAPGKLLMAYYQELTKEGITKLRGDSLEAKLKWLARWRDGLGYYASIEEGEPPVLVERHHPLLDVLEKYPEAIAMEENMIASLLGCGIQREEKRLDGITEWRFIPRT